MPDQPTHSHKIAPQTPDQSGQSASTPLPRPMLLGGAALIILVAVLVLVLPLLSGGGRQQPASTSINPAEIPGAVAVESSMLDSTDGVPLNVGDVAPDFAFTLADGTTRRLSDLRGNRVLINFWATWCAPCTAEMPDIQHVYTTYRNEGFEVLAVNRNEEVGQIAAFATELNLTIPLIANPAGDIGDGYGARGLPTSYFINRDGTVHFRKLGIMTDEFIEQRLGEMQ